MLNLAYNIKIICSKPPILEKQILNRWLFYKKLYLIPINNLVYRCFHFYSHRVKEIFFQL